MKYADYFERKRHGSPDFPIQYYHVNSSNPQYIMVPHWHKEFEIIRVSEGEFRVFLNNVEYRLGKGDVLFVECGYLHRGEPYDSVYECVVFDLNMLCRQQNDAAAKFISPLLNSSVGITGLLSQADGDIHVTVNSLFETLREKKQYYELEIYSLLFKLFSQLYSRNNFISPTSRLHTGKTEAVIRLMDWIEKNLTETITLDKLSAFSGLNKKYLCRIFKEYTSKTLVSYINELRVENACYEISVKGESVTRAAFDSGFNDLSYFCKIFKKHKGITPGEYKKQQSG